MDFHETGNMDNAPRNLKKGQGWGVEDTVSSKLLSCDDIE